MGTGAIAYKTGLIGSRDAPDFAAQATEAAARQQWDSVLDLTDKGLARSPRDRRLLDIRARASASALAAAKAKAAAGDSAGAMHLAKVAAQLEPVDGEAAALVATLAEPPPAAPVESSIPRSSGARSTPVATATTARAMVDLSTARPGVGQPVDMAAHLQGKAKVEGASFHILGPGIAPGHPPRRGR